jgi:hypothetical protein
MSTANLALAPDYRDDTVSAAVRVPAALFLCRLLSPDHGSFKTTRTPTDEQPWSSHRHT